MMGRLNDKLRCWEVERDLALYLSDDLSAEVRAAFDDHLRACTACSSALASARDLLALLEVRPVADPPPVLLNSCRDELQEMLDAVPPGRRSRWKWFLHAIDPTNWILAHPAWSAALLIVVGVSLGYAAPGLIRQVNQTAEAQPLFTVTPASDNLCPDDMKVSYDPGSGQQPGVATVQTGCETPVAITGSPDNPDVRNVLVYTLRNADRFGLDVRLNALETLRTRMDDTLIRETLIYAARNDSNPGVRLKAMESLRGQEQDERVRQAYLEAVVYDANLGVRAEAVTALRTLAESSRGVPYGDERIVTVLRDRMARDPNTFIRLQSAAAVRQIEPRQTH